MEKVGMVSLGCPKNLVDSEIMLGLLEKAGYIIVNKEQEADVLIVNTCSFIDDAKEESIKAILETAQNKKKGKCRVLLVAGCLAQRYGAELLAGLPEVDGIIGTGSVPEIAAAVRQALAGERMIAVAKPGFEYTGGLPRVSSTPPFSAYLKIADGCNNCCSYCVIPGVRGSYRSRPFEDVIEEAAALVNRNVREIILVAQDTTAYGMDRYGRYRLAELLRQLAAIDGLRWLRFLYTYPTRLGQDLIEVMAGEPKICRYLDVPLQHVSDGVLTRMNRQMRQKDIRQLIERLRSVLPGLVLRTSFIVGFPGETESEFQELLDFMAEMKFERVGVFTYSREEGTAAALMPGQVGEQKKGERRERAMLLQQEISYACNRAMIGKVITVLVEEAAAEKKGLFWGRSEADAPAIDGVVYIKTGKELVPGDFVQVLVKEAYPYDLGGVLVTGD
ncbi:MAG: 30S ribosomal protein S12 methylthiotransferase RimO [Peptococcaceae bacterium]|jgi:ribosomal protein S12 methylthiotransferase|nr:MAG: 30S ribosomal protein S12 methylthiotransferase RimO [Peptococcaceae bacterium]